MKLPLTALIAIPGVLAAQGPAASYTDRYGEVIAMAPRPDRMAAVKDLVLERDLGRFELQNGSLYLLSSVGGRTVAAIFTGAGTFRLTPPTAVERARLRRFSGADSIAASFTDLVLIFADSTAAELERRVDFGSGTPPGTLRGIIKRALDYEGEEKQQYLEPDLLEHMLNGSSSDYFYAHLSRGGGDPWMYSVNPSLTEGVQLSRRAKGTGFTRVAEAAAQFPLRGAGPAAGTGERLRQAEIRHYALETFLPRTGAGSVNFSARAKLEITSRTPIGPWVAFHLFRKLDVDSARWSDGSRATVFKGHESPALWVHLGTPLAAGESRTLELFYHGDLVDRFGEWFFIESSSAWYPRTLEGRSAATFDLTYHTPRSFLFASAGDLVDSVESGGTVTTRWVASTPMRNASFNLGRFEHYPFEGPGGLPVALLFSEDGHRQLAESRRAAASMGKQVGADVANSMKFFDHVFGPLAAKRFYASEIPYGHGEAFPGLIHLSAYTFSSTGGGEDNVGETLAREGWHEWFRAHEVAHQWWGIGVDFSTYHDQWLSEGFASFAGLWYLQTIRKDNGKYFGMLERWRRSILDRGQEPGPISLGYRVARIERDNNDYNLIVYQKGAWVVHMLRILMLDLKTMNEDRFTGMMRDFYTTYRGKRASTEDFQRIVEKHVATDMSWFFDQWVRQAAIPTYRVSYTTEPGDNGRFRVKLRVLTENVPADFRMYVPITAELAQNQMVRARVQVKGPSAEVELPLLPSAPKSVRFNDLQGVLADVKMEGGR